jgi:large subunit ribosomal protein L22
MEARASLKNARIATRKARVICDMVRGQHVAEAIDQLKFTRKAAAPLVSKLINSAISNAQQQNQDVDLDRLYVKTAYADEASDHFMVRWRPRAQGRATPIQKGMSHITVILAERED